MFKKKNKGIKNLKNYKSPIKEVQVYKMQHLKQLRHKYKHLIKTENRGKPLSNEEKELIIKIYINYKLMPSNFKKRTTEINRDVAEL